MAHVAELCVKHPELKFQKTLALLLGWRWAPWVSDSPTANILFRWGSLLLGPVALLSSSHVPTWLLSSLLCRGSPLRSHCCQGPREGSILIPRPRDTAWCWDFAQGSVQWPLCVWLCTSAHLHACFFSQREMGSKQSKGWGREPWRL